MNEKELKLCECGCGGEIKFNMQTKTYNRFIVGHQNRKKRKALPCSCGCELKTTGREKIIIKGNLFIKGHEKKGINNHKQYLKNKAKEKENRWASGLWPCHKDIVEYNAELFKKGKFKIKINEALRKCWVCGRETSNLVRAHVIARRHCNGNNHPSNIWLLCGGCHSVQPDNMPREAQFNWISKMPAFNSQTTPFQYCKGVISLLSVKWGIDEDSPVFNEIFFYLMKLRQQNEGAEWQENETKAHKNGMKRVSFTR